MVLTCGLDHLLFNVGTSLRLDDHDHMNCSISLMTNTMEVFVYKVVMGAFVGVTVAILLLIFITSLCAICQRKRKYIGSLKLHMHIYVHMWVLIIIFCAIIWSVNLEQHFNDLGLVIYLHNHQTKVFQNNIHSVSATKLIILIWLW